MKRLILFLLFLFAAYPARAQQATGNITSGAGCGATSGPGCVVLGLPTNVSSVSVAVGGNFSANLAVQQSADGGNSWTSAGSAITSGSTTNYTIKAQNQFRVCAAPLCGGSYVSGTAFVSILYSTAASGGGGSGTVSGQTPNCIPKASAVSALTGCSSLSDNGTTVSTPEAVSTGALNSVLLVLCNGTSGAPVNVTSALAAALTSLNSSGGGVIQLTAGFCYDTAQIAPTYTGASSPTQYPVRITGQTANLGYPNGATIPLGGTVLDLQYSASTAKILTLGGGSLEIDHLTLEDTMDGTLPFIWDTFTSPNIHDVTFKGKTCSSNSNTQDFIVLGGTGTSLTAPASTSGFQGYQGKIWHNYFSCGRGILLQSDSNAVVIAGNTWDPTTGGTHAIYANGASGHQSIGGTITQNLFEATGFPDAITELGLSGGYQIFGNSYWDNGSTAEMVLLDTATGYNDIHEAAPSGGGSTPMCVDNSSAKTSSCLSSYPGLHSLFNYEISGIPNFASPNGTVLAELVALNGAEMLLQTNSAYPLDLGADNKINVSLNTDGSSTFNYPVSSTIYNTGTNCAATGSGANPSLVACSAAPSGSFSCATNASTGTCTVATTAVTANSNIFVQPVAATVIGTKLGVTCNTTADTGLVAPRLAAQVAATSFTINLGTFATNPECFNYWIVD